MGLRMTWPGSLFIDFSEKVVSKNQNQNSLIISSFPHFRKFQLPRNVQKWQKKIGKKKNPFSLSKLSVFNWFISMAFIWMFLILFLYKFLCYSICFFTSLSIINILSLYRFLSMANVSKSENYNKPSEEESELRRGPWTIEEDTLLIHYIAGHGEGQWNILAKQAGIFKPFAQKFPHLFYLSYFTSNIHMFSFYGLISFELFFFF